jgi:cytochrome c553
MRPALLIASMFAAATAGAQQVQVPDTLAQRTLACTICHGKEGRATNQGYFPRIAGKPAGYLYNQLVNFRDGRRHNETMTYLVEHLSDDYLKDIAGHFASLDLPWPPPQPPVGPPESIAHGEQLVRHGDPARRIPACVQCHGSAMTGALPALPGLLGLPRDYLVSQLGGWKTGERHAAAPDCMAEVAKQLDDRDINALASWLAAQPLPADPKPAPAQSIDKPLPLRCGSGT